MTCFSLRMVLVWMMRKTLSGYAPVTNISFLNLKLVKIRKFWYYGIQLLVDRASNSK